MWVLGDSDALVCFILIYMLQASIGSLNALLFKSDVHCSKA